jgi:cbb3-type cytochrome oxidase maturation protein
LQLYQPTLLQKGLGLLIKQEINISVIVLLIGVSLLVAIGFLIAFLIAVKKGQYKDTHTPAIRVLFDNETEEKKEKNNSGSK